jgi:hypothetical protein
MTAHVYDASAPKDTATSLVRVSRGLQDIMRARLPIEWTVAPMALTASKDELRMYFQRAPAVYVSWMRSEAAAAGARSLRTRSQFVVSIVVRGAKVDQRLAGDRLGHGLYQLAETLSIVLHGATIENVGAVQVTGLDTPLVESPEGIAIATITVAIHHAIDAGGLLTTELPDLTALAMEFVVGGEGSPTSTTTHNPQEAP